MIEQMKLICILTCMPTALAFTKTVGFNDDDCDKYRHYLNSEEDSYEVVWDGEEYPTFCTLRFNMLSSDTYRVCADVTEFDLDCSRNVQLIFFWGVGMKERVHKYNCYGSLPIRYCNDDNVFIKLEPRYNNIRRTNSKLRITITATKSSSSDTSDDDSNVLVPLLVSFVIIGLIIFIICCVCVRQSRAARAAQNINFGTVISERRINHGTSVQQNREQRQQNPAENIHMLPNSRNEWRQDSHNNLLSTGTAGRNSPHLTGSGRNSPAFGGSSSGRHSPFQGGGYAGRSSPLNTDRSPHDIGYERHIQPSAPSFDYNQVQHQYPIEHSGQRSQQPYDIHAPPPSYSEVIGKAEEYNIK